ncbi:hypothetical protein [Marinobacter orientalis]|uniref:Uncharacterized protein n=1 Tax=Marinobacter orientalis TaxID=1928859 RepID=A0A7Y0RC24_9GAMM|nr:hypothetical protein [Marinobacter orientalis]NMT63483.1 hypothetical protein [Marinobacter orientalis]TGX48544.1 hypothetical protein DIT72_14215 [Marinobacter orientalis]
MCPERVVILKAAFTQSPIRSVGPNAVELNVPELADSKVRRLLDAATSLCTEFAEQFFPDEKASFLHGDFVTNLDSGMEHTSEVYLDQGCSKALVSATTAAAALFLKSVIHGATDLFNLDRELGLTGLKKKQVDQFSKGYIATNSGQSLKNPFVIHLPNGEDATEIAVQGHIEKAAEIETKTREYLGLAELDGASHHQKTITLRLIEGDIDTNKILKIRANSVGELKTAFCIAQTDHRQAYVRLHQVQDGQQKLHWHLDEIGYATEHKHPELSLVQ